MKSMWWNDEVKDAVKRKEAPWKEVLGARYEDAKERCMEVYRKEKRKVKRCIYQRKNEVNVQFRRKLNQDIDGNRKLFWKEVSKVKSCSKIKDGNGRMALWHWERLKLKKYEKDYFKDLYIINTQEQVAVHMYDFDGVQRGNYFGGELIRRTELEVRVGKLKNGNTAGKDKFTGEIIKGEGERVVNWI